MIDFGYYLRNGLIKHQGINFNQIEKQIIRAEKDLDTFTFLAQDGRC